MGVSSGVGAGSDSGTQGNVPEIQIQLQASDFEHPAHLPQSHLPLAHTSPKSLRKKRTNIGKPPLWRPKGAKLSPRPRKKPKNLKKPKKSKKPKKLKKKSKNGRSRKRLYKDLLPVGKRKGQMAKLKIDGFKDTYRQILVKKKSGTDGDSDYQCPGQFEVKAQVFGRGGTRRRRS